MNSWIKWKMEHNNSQKLWKSTKISKTWQSAIMKIKIWITKINFIFISIFQIGPVKQLIKLVSPNTVARNIACVQQHLTGVCDDGNRLVIPKHVINVMYEKPSHLSSASFSSASFSSPFHYFNHHHLHQLFKNMLFL